VEFSEEQTLFMMLANLPMAVFGFWVLFRVFRKAGHSGWWVLLMAVPLVNVIMLWVFSFIRWPGLEAAKSDHTSEIFS
jgi:uncharacterized membrane protein YhaH (DUF805 family)